MHIIEMRNCISRQQQTNATAVPAGEGEFAYHRPVNLRLEMAIAADDLHVVPFAQVPRTAELSQCILFVAIAAEQPHIYCVGMLRVRPPQG